MGHCCAEGAAASGIAADAQARLFVVEGLDCAEEVRLLKDAVGPLLEAHETLGFDVLRGQLSVPGGARVSDARIIAAIRSTGMNAQRIDADRADQSSSSDRRPVIAAIASGVAILAAMIWHGVNAWQGSALSLVEAHPAGLPLAELLLYGAAIAAAGAVVARKAWLSLRRLRPDMNLLMSVAVLGAMALGEWLEAATVAFLFTLSLGLESWSLGRARRAVEALLDLRPHTARVPDGAGGWRQRPVAEVAVGTTVQVRAGDRIPLDGEVISGRSSVDESAVTGESVPAVKNPGDDVYAGTISSDGTLELRTTRVAGQTLLARIMRLVTSADSRRAHSEQWVERFARYYTPAVMGLAVAVALLLPVAFGWAWGEAVYSALVLLVVACPCALVISTPVSIVAALASCARHGVLVKGGRFLELPAALRSVAFDKTGTLTEGRHRVAAVQPLGDYDEAALLALAGSLAAQSNHPLAAAIREAALKRDAAPLEVTDVHTLPGLGVMGRVDGVRTLLGSRRFLAEQGTDTAALEAIAAEHEQKGRTIVAVGTEDGLLGAFALSDRLRPEALEAIAALAKLGVKQRVMVTGDRRAAADGIADGLALTAVEAELMPEEKLAIVERLSAADGPIAFVGDGVNDAPAMARADLGVAMGALGSDVAIETADVALMGDELQRLPWLVRHARRTRRIIAQNVVLSLVVKAVFVLLTLLGVASLWGAIAADEGVSLLVVLNALRLLRSENFGAVAAAPERAAAAST